MASGAASKEALKADLEPEPAAGDVIVHTSIAGMATLQTVHCLTWHLLCGDRSKNERLSCSEAPRLTRAAQPAVDGPIDRQENQVSQGHKKNAAVVVLPLPRVKYYASSTGYDSRPHAQKIVSYPYPVPYQFRCPS